MILLFKPLVLSQEYYNEVLFWPESPHEQFLSQGLNISLQAYIPNTLHLGENKFVSTCHAWLRPGQEFQNSFPNDSWQTMYDIYLVEEVSTNLRKDKKKANLYSPTVFPSSLKSQNHGSTCWILFLLFKKSQDCQLNYAKQLDDSHFSKWTLNKIHFLFMKVSIYTLILVSKVQHSGSTVTYIIKFSPPLVQSLSSNVERCYKIIEYILHAALPSQWLTIPPPC